MSLESRWKLIRFAITSLFLFGCWMLFTASTDTYSVIAGVCASLLGGYLTYGVFIPKHQANLRYTVPNPFTLIIYLGVLIYYLYQSSFKMLVAVITGNCSPRIVHFRTRLKSDVARMTLANSITFTPGTMTLDLNDDHLTVHWLFCDTNHAKLAGEQVKGRLEGFIGKIWL
ncbi:MAG: Na+/H+ antiporter subunit E [Spirochaetales bacterium]|nr:Na+/H+ antiporter subunit E [Spirochaetales bacterium]